MTDYIELRSRSAFSFLSGASTPEDLIAHAARLGYPALALGDRDGVYGAPRFHQAAKRAGIKAMVAAEVQVVGLLGCEVVGASTTTPLYLIAADRDGYRNLCSLITESKLCAPKGSARLSWAHLEERSAGLICFVRDALKATNNVTTNNPTTSAFLTRVQSLFANRLYLELHRHLDRREERFNRALIDLARQAKLPLVASNDVRHACQDGRRLLDILTCIGAKTTLDAAGRGLISNAERHLKSPAAMAALFRDVPEAVRNTARIAEQCEFTLENLGYRFPEYPLPPGATAIGYLRELTYRGARDRYGQVLSTKVRRQLEHELAVIAKLDLPGYFLIVWDIVRFCREQNILAQGRGSAANSAVCYSLGITSVDAIGMDLLFERFLSEERGEWPDIDIDLPSGDQREKVIQYVYQRYGQRGAAMTANVITYRTRSAVREVGKALGFSLAQVDKLSKLLSRFEFRDDLDDLQVQLKAGGVDPAAPRVRLLVDLVRQIQGLPRHLGQHSGGMVIAAGRLDHVVPLEPASMPGRVVVQWDKDDCADLGIIKVDLLGLGMMAVLEDAIPMIREHENVEVDMAHIPANDPKTYAMLRRADTIGVFQVESRAQMATLPRMKPDHFYDLVVQVAIIRPGPIVGQMVHPYLDRRNGRAPVVYDHPDLEPILKRTLGVPLFQEQLLRIAMALAGFTGGEAEELRRAMGFKRSQERMKEIDRRLRAGMSERGIVGAKQDQIVRSITSFALYGFPESHAASFALIAYASAYLRAHHLAAFTCAMLNNWPLGFYHPATLVKDAQRHGLQVLPIDVNRSGWKCNLEKVVGLLGCEVVRPEDLALRLGLRFVKGLREDAGKRVMHERDLAPFQSVADVIHRCELRDHEVETLAHAGAFASFGLNRREALWQASAVPREPLLRAGSVAVDSLKTPARKTHNPMGGNDGESGSVVSGSDRVATGDGVGERLLPTDEIVPARRDVRSNESDTPSVIIGGIEHRGGKRPRNAPGLRSVSEGRPGQSARITDLFLSDRRGGDRTTGSRPSDSRADRIGSQAFEPADPIALAETNNVTTNNLTTCPLPTMSAVDVTLADYKSTGLTSGSHITAHLRDTFRTAGVVPAVELAKIRNGRWIKIAGLVIVRQRPGTAKGMCFITLEDETGTSNAAVRPDIFAHYRAVIHTAALLQIEGPVQQVDGVIHVLARRLHEIKMPGQTITQSGSGYRMRTTPEQDPVSKETSAEVTLPGSHDFH